MFYQQGYEYGVPGADDAKALSICEAVDCGIS
jgi:hypothetical protein